MELTLISIIIPTYNRAHLIGETLDSVIAQTYQNWECIVIDDGSTDYTEELLEFYCEKHSLIQYHRRPLHKPKGANACRNYGFELSRGEFINWFDSDDIMHPEKLQYQITAIRNKSQKDLNFCEYNLCDSRLNSAVRKKFSTENLLINYLKQKAFFNLPTTLFHKDILKKYKLDETLYKAQEVDFFLRLLQDSHLKFNKVDKSLVYVRLHDNNITSSFKNGSANAINSEMQVKLKALEYLKKEGSRKDLEEFLYLYYLFLITILDQNLLKLYFKYVCNLFFYLPGEYFKRIIKMLWLGCVFITFKRRPYRYRNIFNFN